MIISDKKTELAHRGNKVVYADGDRIVKVFNGTKPVSDIFNEALNIARVEETGMRCPKVLEVSEAADGWAIATEYVPGTTLAEVAAKDPSHEKKYLEQFVTLQLEVHKHTSPLLQRQKDKYARMIDSLDCVDATTRYELQMRLDGMKPGSAVCHGDFNPTNVIVGEDGKLYVCDWAHATQGCGEADAAMTYLLFALEDQAKADAYLDLYCARADTPKQVVRHWLSIVAASELARGRKVNDEFLMGWIDVADYQ
jgi:aminoglycoside phosphotransferase (APT) family kinase protein